MSIDTFDPADSGRVIAVVNQKGGVGKTTTAINLGCALAEAAQRVLIIDLDPQGNASTGLGVAAASREVSIYDVLLYGAPVLAAVQPSSVEGLSIIPATQDLSGADLELVSDEDRALRLRTALRGDPVLLADYDYVLIDCPPSLSLLTVNALTAADGVIVPLQCEFYALEGLTQLLATVNRIRSRLNPDLKIHGIVLTMSDRRNRLSTEVEEDVRNNLSQYLFETVIPRNVRLSEAPSMAMPALVYDSDCAGSRAYRNLAVEVLRRDMQGVAA